MSEGEGTVEEDKEIEKKEATDTIDDNTIEDETEVIIEPLKKSIFNPYLRRNGINEKFSMTSQEYLGKKRKVSEK
jgi:hypothetical protein